MNAGTSIVSSETVGADDQQEDALLVAGLSLPDRKPALFLSENRFQSPVRPLC